MMAAEDLRAPVRSIVMTPFRKLLSYFAPYRRTLIFGISCVFMTNVFKLITPDFLRRAMDTLGRGAAHEDLLKFGGLIVLTAVAQGVFLFTQRRLLINMSRHIEYDLRSDFYSHLEKLPFE